MNCGVISKKGRVRSENQDSYQIVESQDYSILAVADGMGGHNGGSVASSLAIEGLDEYDFKINDLKDSISGYLKLVNKKIIEKGLAESEYQGMGTTLTLAMIYKDELTIGHIGDSRAYLWRKQRLTQLSDDHSYVGELLRNNLISKSEAKDHPKKNLLTKALGVDQEVDVDVVEFKLEPNDILLLCSDGLTNMVSERELIDILSSELSLQEQAEKMGRLANQAGGYDNITAIVYRH